MHGEMQRLNRTCRTRMQKTRRVSQWHADCHGMPRSRADLDRVHNVLVVHDLIALSLLLSPVRTGDEQFSPHVSWQVSWKNVTFRSCDLHGFCDLARGAPLVFLLVPRRDLLFWLDVRRYGAQPFLDPREEIGCCLFGGCVSRPALPDPSWRPGDGGARCSVRGSSPPAAASW